MKDGWILSKPWTEMWAGPMIFGEMWDAPVCDNATPVPTPVGRVCLYCEEEIVDGDQGFMRQTILLVGEPTLMPVHRNCDLRMVIGSVGHIKKTCPCFGGTENDPDGMSKRQAADAAVHLYLGGMES